MILVTTLKLVGYESRNTGHPVKIELAGDSLLAKFSEHYLTRSPPKNLDSADDDGTLSKKDFILFCLLLKSSPSPTHVSVQPGAQL